MSARAWDGIAVVMISIALVSMVAWTIDSGRDLSGAVLYAAIGMFCHLKARLKEIEDGRHGR